MNILNQVDNLQSLICYIAAEANFILKIIHRVQYSHIAQSRRGTLCLYFEAQHFSNTLLYWFGVDQYLCRGVQ